MWSRHSHPKEVSFIHAETNARVCEQTPLLGRGTARRSTHLGHLPPAPSELSLKELISQIVSSEAQGCARKKGRAISNLNVFQEVFKFNLIIHFQKWPRFRPGRVGLVLGHDFNS